MRTGLAALVPLVSIAFAGHAQVVPGLPPVSNSDSMLIGRIFEPVYQDFSSRGERSAAATKWEVEVGVGHTKGEDKSKTTSAPFEISATLPAGTILKLASRYVRTELFGFEARGLADITFQVIQPVAAIGDGGLLLAAGVSVPSATDVSAGHASQALAAYFMHRLGNSAKVLAVAQASHTNVPLPPGISEQAYAGVVRLVHGIGGSFDRSVWFQYVSARRSGTKTASQVVAAYETPFTEKLGARLTASRGLTSGKKDTSANLTLIWAF